MKNTAIKSIFDNYKATSIKLCFCFFILVFVFSSLLAQGSPLFDNGVLINDVIWATRNVDTPGTFVPLARDFGKYYQWNRGDVGWSIFGNNAIGWNSNMPQGNTWESANDPSPYGWRLPTIEEIQTLFDTDKVENEWVTDALGVAGRRFTDKETGRNVFFPAAGFRGSDGVLGNTQGEYGNYWSSSPDFGGTAKTLNFSAIYASWQTSSNRTGGLSVRSVAINQPYQNDNQTDDDSESEQSPETPDTPVRSIIPIPPRFSELLDIINLINEQ